MRVNNFYVFEIEESTRTSWDREQPCCSNVSSPDQFSNDNDNGFARIQIKYRNNKTTRSVPLFDKYALIRVNLPIKNCRGQAYDGASNMQGNFKGVASRIQQEEPSAIHVHCLAHCLNLCLQDVTR